MQNVSAKHGDKSHCEKEHMVRSNNKLRTAPTCTSGLSTRLQNHAVIVSLQSRFPAFGITNVIEKYPKNL